MRRKLLVLSLRGLQGLTVLGAGVIIVLVAGSGTARSSDGCSRLYGAKAELKSLVAAVLMYEVDRGELPTADEGLAVLLARPDGRVRGEWKGPYLEGGEVPRDPWGNHYVYRRLEPEGGFELVSPGPDGVVGTEDDVQELRRVP